MNTNTNKPTKKIIIISVAVTIVIVIIATIFLPKLFRSDKATVLLALSKTYGSESIFAIMSGNESLAGNSLFEKPYINDCKNALATKRDLEQENNEITLNVTIEDMSGKDMSEDLTMLKKAGLNTTTYIDRANTEAYTKMELNYSGLSLMNGAIYQTADSFSLEIPELLEDGYVTATPKTFVEDYNHSLITLVAPGKISDDFNLDYSLNATTIATPDYVEHFSLLSYINTAEGHQKLSDLYEALAVSSTGNKETLTIADKNVKCKEYAITAPASTLSDFTSAYLTYLENDVKQYLNDNPGILNYYSNPDLQDEAVTIDDKKEKLLSEMHASFQETIQNVSSKDYTFYVYLDSKNRLLKYYFNDTLLIDGIESDFIFTYVMNGENKLTDNISGSVTIKNNLGKLQYDYASNSTEDNSSLIDAYHLKVTQDGKCISDTNISIDYTKKDHCLSLTYDNLNEDNDNLKIEYKGYTDVDPDKKVLKIDITKLNIFHAYAADDYVQSYSGKYKICPLENEVKKPEGNEYKLFDLDIFSLYDFAEQLEANWKKTKLYQLIG